MSHLIDSVLKLRRTRRQYFQDTSALSALTRYTQTVEQRVSYASPDNRILELTQRQHILGQHRLRELPLVLHRERDGRRRDRLSFRHRHRLLHSLLVREANIRRR